MAKLGKDLTDTYLAPEEYSQDLLPAVTAISERSSPH